MATIVNNPKYGEGHQVILKDKISSSIIKQKFTQLKYEMGKDVFTLLRSNIPQDPKRITTIDLGGSDTVYLKDNAGKVLLIKGSASVINNTFNHFTENAKSNTGLLTEIKELVSMHLFESLIERKKILPEESIIAMLDSKMKQNYDSFYYTSALAQAKELKKFLKDNTGYEYERQAKDKTKLIYERARKLTNKLNDNWNPADVWMIKKNVKLSEIYNAPNYKELNSLIADALKNKTIIPISLKQVKGQSATLSIVDPSKISKEKLDLDLSPDKIDLSETFNNFIVWTKSGFGVRAGFKASSTTINVSLEGRFRNAGVQVGAVDAKEFSSFTTAKKSPLETGHATPLDLENAKNKYKNMLSSSVIKINTKLSDFNAVSKAVDGGDQLTKDRFFNLMSYMNTFYTIDFEEIIKFCYYSSKKISGVSAPYVIIQ